MIVVIHLSLILFKQPSNLQQLFFLRVEQGHKDAVQGVIEILDQNPNLIYFSNDKTGQTLLTITTRKNDIRMTALLIQRGADINA